MPPTLRGLPLPFLCRRIDRDLEGGSTILGLQDHEWWSPDPQVDVSIEHRGHRLESPLALGASPYLDFAHGIVRGWVAGARLFEIPTWSHAEAPPASRLGSPGLTPEASFDEIAKAIWLITGLQRRQGRPPGGFLIDVCLGEDLSSIRASEGLLHRLQRATPLWKELRGQLAGLSGWDDLEPPKVACDAVTIVGGPRSTPAEVAAMVQRTLDWGFHSWIKLPGAVLGTRRLGEVLGSVGHSGPAVDQEALEDGTLDEWARILQELGAAADAKGLSLGVKLCRPVPLVGGRWLSGPGLLPVAVQLALELKKRLSGEAIPMALAGGFSPIVIEDAVSAGLAPVHATTDLLRGKGLGRISQTLRHLSSTVRAQDTKSLEAWQHKQARHYDLRMAHARVLRDWATRTIAQKSDGAAIDGTQPPAWIDHRGDPLCPHGSLFKLPVQRGKVAPGVLDVTDGRLTSRTGPLLEVATRQLWGVRGDLASRPVPTSAEEPSPTAPLVLYGEEADLDENLGYWCDPAQPLLTWRRAQGIWRLKLLGDGLSTLWNDQVRVHLLHDRPLSGVGTGEVDLRIAVWMRMILEALVRNPGAAWLDAASPAENPMTPAPVPRRG